jgi:hypothetical protein
MSLFYSARHDRTNVNLSIDFVFDPFDAADDHKGIVENISETGFCLITSVPIEEGQEITIKSLVYLPSQNAVACWVEKHEGRYKAGFRFV